jgi:hypothetical protein
MLESKVLSAGAYSADDRPPIRPLKKRAPYPRMDKRPALMVVLLLSLGLWAAIWGVVASLASAVSG